MEEIDKMSVPSSVHEIRETVTFTRDDIRSARQEDFASQQTMLFDHNEVNSDARALEHMIGIVNVLSVAEHEMLEYLRRVIRSEKRLQFATAIMQVFAGSSLFLIASQLVSSFYFTIVSAVIGFAGVMLTIISLIVVSPERKYKLSALHEKISQFLVYYKPLLATNRLSVEQYEHIYENYKYFEKQAADLDIMINMQGFFEGKDATEIKRMQSKLNKTMILNQVKNG